MELVICLTKIWGLQKPGDTDAFQPVKLSVLQRPITNEVIIYVHAPAWLPSAELSLASLCKETELTMVKMFLPVGDLTLSLILTLEALLCYC